MQLDPTLNLMTSNMGETSWTLTIETERLILRPQEAEDYETWYAGFSGRLPQQHKYTDASRFWAY